MHNKHIVNWLRFITFFLFLGRGWQHLVYNGPYSTVFFAQNSIGGFISWITQTPYHELASNGSLSNWYDFINDGLAIIFFAGAFASLLINKKKGPLKKVYLLAWISLFLVAIGYWVEKKFVTAQFFEYSAQLMTPFLFLMAVKYKMKKKFLFLSKVAIAITFVCHGLYAIGYYPLPANFSNMMINFFAVSDETAAFWLKIIGYTDFVFALGLFIKPIYKYVLVYGLIWGFLTAMARLYVNLDFEFLQLSFKQNTFEFLVRMPHFIIPLYLLRYKKEIFI